MTTWKEVIEQIRQSCYLLKIDDGNLILPPGREYKIAEDNKCAE